jgi:hypothetical protein
MSRALILAPLTFTILHAQNCHQRTAEDFIPLTTSERLVNDLDSVVSPGAFLFVAARAGVDHAMDRPKEWGQGVRGYSMRTGSVFAENFIAQVLEQSADFKLHHDTRYFASGKKGFAPRLGYAVASTVLARHDDGSRTFAYPAVGSAAAAAFIVRAWQPGSTTGAGDAAVSFGLTMGVRMGINIAREFTPRLRGIVLR